MTKWLARATVGLAAALAAVAGAAQESPSLQMLSYEAIPSAQVPLALDSATYEQRAEVTQAALAEIAPAVADAVGLDPAAIETEVTPGGYLLKTNASLQARAVLTDAEADRFAAALGYVFRQWSVLVSQPGDPDESDTGYVVVGFPEDALTPALAQRFFEFAAQVHKGLGGGYTAFGDEMLFLNVRDAEGAPYSMLEDMGFAARLGLAAGAFPDSQAKIADAGFAEARFVGNDWEGSPDGEDYAAWLEDPALIADLDALRAAHTALVLRYADAFGWR